MDTDKQKTEFAEIGGQNLGKQKIMRKRNVT